MRYKQMSIGNRWSKFDRVGEVRLREYADKR